MMSAANTQSHSSESPTVRKFNLWRTLGWSSLIVGVLAIAFVAWLAFVMHRMATETVPDMYGQWHTANMIVAYMGDHEDQWPKSWDDLKPYSERQAEWWTFEELQNRVRVDFNADVNSLKSAPVNPDGRVTIEVVELTSGKRVYYEGAEPNQLIWEYLQHRVAAEGKARKP